MMFDEIPKLSKHSIMASAGSVLCGWMWELEDGLLMSLYCCIFNNYI